MRPQSHALILLEFNEVNFDFVGRYIQRGYLKSIAALLDSSGIAETTSEERIERLEPWIQWVTAHTGLPHVRHRIFRLGDIVNGELEQIWEKLEANGVTVGAIANAADRTRRSLFLVPDPWTQTPASGGWVLGRLSAALSLTEWSGFPVHAT